jgi:hypothetical protein
MKWQLTEHYPGPRNMFLEVGTILDWADPNCPYPLPLCAMALDQPALDALCNSHHPDLWSRLQYARGLKLPDPGYIPPPPQRNPPQ